MLTVTGPAGVGKSRLALRVAQAVRASFADGVVLVDLSRVADAEGLAPVVLGALDVAAADDWSALARQVEGLDLLLVLDNCERVIGACAELALASGAMPTAAAADHQPRGAADTRANMSGRSRRCPCRALTTRMQRSQPAKPWRCS